MARPLKLSKAIVDQLCENIKLGVSYDAAAKGAGIGVNTLYRMKRDGRAVFENNTAITKDFSKEYIAVLQYFIEKVPEAQAVAEINLVKKLQAAASEGQWQAAKFILQARFGWSTQSEIVHTHNQNVLGSGNDDSIDVSKLTTRELEELVAGENRQALAATIDTDDQFVEGEVSE